MKMRDSSEWQPIRDALVATIRRIHRQYFRGVERETSGVGRRSIWVRPQTALLSALLAAWACAPPSQPHSDLEPAQRALANRCQQGEASGCEELGLILLPDERLFGEAEPKRDARALALFERACKLGATESCLRLGAYRLHHGEGRWEGQQLLNQLCFEANDDRACALLADFVGDPEAAKKACEAGRDGACVQQAVLLYRRSPQDVAPALAMMEQHCEDGIAQACHQRALWSQVQEQNEAPGNESDPVYWFSAACDGGIPEACERKVVLLFDEAVRTGEQAPCGEITTAATHGCAAQLPGACLLRDFCKSAASEQLPLESPAYVCGAESGLGCYLQLLLESGQASQTTFPRFDPSLLPQLEQACDSRYLPACMAAARLQLDGVGSRGPSAQAIRSLEYGCRQDYGVACYYLAPVYVQSQHAPRDMQHAVALMQTACEQSVLDACDRVQELKAQPPAVVPGTPD